MLVWLDPFNVLLSTVLLPDCRMKESSTERLQLEYRTLVEVGIRDPAPLAGLDPCPSFQYG
jgi:hypothetical protein